MQSSSYIAPPLLDGVVTFLDVLGWKGVYNRISNATVQLSVLVDGLRNEGEKQRGKVQGEVQVRSISDTIAIFTKCDIEEASIAINIHGELANWAILNSIQAEIPVRGAISFGEFAIQDNIFIGKAVDEAAAWHEHADWIGVHLTPSAEFIFQNDKTSKTWVTYTPPNKRRLTWKPHCVNWTANWSNRTEEIIKLKEKFLRLGPIVPDIAFKLTNTLSFIDATNTQPRRRWFNIFE
ncbi:MAG: hypothetical protein KAU35_05935 [candidate division Zixibacteria bacterium]|nr:hypothetical protein [candidate division Zixibacteria bacterium]